MTARRLHLMTSELPPGLAGPPAPTTTTDPAGAESPRVEPAPAEPPADEESSALQRMRLERDAALEELAFLREQICGAQAYYEHQFELVVARLYSEHRSLLEELTRLGPRGR